MRNKMLFVIGIMLFILGQIGVNYLLYKYKNKNVEIPRVQLRDVEENKKDKKSSFAIMLEQDDGSYKITSSNSFDHPGYVYNSRKSKCVDDYGNVVENILNYDNDTKMMGVKTSKTAYCYVYFDKLKNLYEACGSNNMSSCESSGKLISVESLWQSGLEGDGYRYVGTNPNNYICFGTTNKSTCTGNTDAYMYRIIGIFADSSGNQYLKLIKKEALNTKYTWNDSNSDVDWDESNLYKRINDTETNSKIYLKNTTYIPDGWSDRIRDWTWREVNTLTYESSGTSYYYSSPKSIYQNEMLKANNSSITCAYGSDTDRTSARCAVGELKTKPAKIGLMYASDYALSLGSTALNLTTGTYTNRATLKTGWMHITNNDTGNPGSNYEWTISRFGKNNFGGYSAWPLGSDGYIGNDGVRAAYSVRPVFFLNDTEVIASGTGTLSDPYLLS